MTLAQLRHFGVTINLKPDGGLGVVGASPAIIEAIKQNKAAIIATLKSERLGGIDYHDSKVYWSLNVLYDNWYSLPESEERNSALRLCAKWDSALTDNFKAGAQMVIEEQPMLELLAESAPLEGHALYSQIKRMSMALTQGEYLGKRLVDIPTSRPHAPQAKPVDRSALDEPTRKTTPKPQGKYTQALRELLSIAESKGGEAARARAVEAIANEFDRLANACGLKYREGITYEEACDQIEKKLEANPELAKRLGITPVQDDLFSSQPIAEAPKPTLTGRAALG